MVENCFSLLILMPPNPGDNTGSNPRREEGEPSGDPRNGNQGGSRVPHVQLNPGSQARRPLASSLAKGGGQAARPSSGSKASPTDTSGRPSRTEEAGRSRGRPCPREARRQALGGPRPLPSRGRGTRHQVAEGRGGGKPRAQRSSCPTRRALADTGLWEGTAERNCRPHPGGVQTPEEVTPENVHVCQKLQSSG